MIDIIIDIAQGAGDILMNMREKGFEIMKKSHTGNPSTDIVTEADFAADKYIREQLSISFPGEQILTEETEKDCIIDRSKPCWVIDPLDGTKNFSKGLDLFGVLIGKVEKGIPILGVAYFPAQDKLFSAEKGNGASCNGIKITSLGTSTIIEGKVNEYIHYNEGVIYNNKNQKLLPGIKSRGCIGRSLCEIASGFLGGAIRTYTLGGKRDTCGPQVILEETGGIITDIGGKELNYKQKNHFWNTGYVVGNKKQHKKILDFLT